MDRTETKTGRCWVQEENTDLSSEPPQKWRTQFNVIVEPYCPGTPWCICPRSLGGMKIYWWFHLQVSKQPIIWNKKATNHSEFNDCSPSTCFEFVGVEGARRLPSPQWESALSERRCSSVPIGLWLRLNNINRGLAAFQTQESVREPECKIDKRKLTRAHLPLWYGSLRSHSVTVTWAFIMGCPVLSCIAGFTSCWWHNGLRSDNADAAFLFDLFLFSNSVSDVPMSRLISFMSCS